MSETQLLVLFSITLIVLSGAMMIGLLKKIQKRTHARDSKITAEMERDNPFSL